MTPRFPVRVASEIGRLTGVILHEPGQEVANMTPETAERALYSDILNLDVARQEYARLRGVLEKRTRVFQAGTLLAEVLADPEVGDGLVRRICDAEGAPQVADALLERTPAEVARVLVEGVPLVKDNLTRFLSPDRYSLPPLHNFFFARDPAVTIGDEVLVSRMASPVRRRESRIMQAIFAHHPVLTAPTVDPVTAADGVPDLTIEGGDVLVAGPEVLVIGIGARTTPRAVDFLIDHFRARGLRRHILVQELPRAPESFIHLDMVFTLLDRDLCLVYAPVVMQTHHFDVVHIHVEGGRVVSITERDTLLAGLARVGLDLEPVFCGGRDDRWLQDREQWHSGANMFALAPGQVMSYGRNTHTLDELARVGFAVAAAEDVADGTVDLDATGRCVVTIDGAELARGGGGCRCMTMPVGREPLA